MLAGFGWGKPTPVNPFRLRNGPRPAGRSSPPPDRCRTSSWPSSPRYRCASAWSTGAARSWCPAASSDWGLNEYVSLFLTAIIIFNVFLAVFNLLPLAPLDGFAVAVGLLPRDLALEVSKLEQYGPAILMALILLPFVTAGQISILHQIMSPVINGLTELIAGGGRAIG